MEKLAAPWGAVRLSSCAPEEDGAARAEVFIPRAVLWREGPESFFACANRFPQEPEDRIDLGPLSEPVYAALMQYLLTDSLDDDRLGCLRYAADVFLLDRLATRLQRRAAAPRLCLNCRTWVTGGGAQGPCRYKPSRRVSPAGLECVACDRASHECRCIRRQAYHTTAGASGEDAL